MLKKLAQKFILFKKKDENSALISVGLVIMLLAVFLIKMGNRHLPENWKSEVEIWGTVSDWFIVLITLVTAVFLYKTLSSQMEVQKQQNIITQIEIKRFRKSIEPKLSIKYSQFHRNEEGKFHRIFFTITSEENLFKNIQFISKFKIIAKINESTLPTSSNRMINSEKSIDNHYITINETFNIKQKITLFIDVTPQIFKEKKEFFEKVIVNFQDEAGYGYEKHIIISHNNTEASDFMKVEFKSKVSEIIYC